LAVRMLSALRERGRHIRDDCAVVICDVVPVAAHTIPRLSTIRISYLQIGEEAMWLLLDAIAEPIAGPRRVLLPLEMVCRESCGCGGRASAAGRTAG
jgi:LacI family transcriptional regulator